MAPGGPVFALKSYASASDSGRKTTSINGAHLLGSFHYFFKILPRLRRVRLLPSVRQLLNCPRFGHGLQGLQRIQNNAPLAFHVARFTEHTTACKLDKHGPGGLDVSHSVGGIARRDSGNSGFLYQTLNQTHGLMTFRSDRHQE